MPSVLLDPTGSPGKLLGSLSQELTPAPYYDMSNSILISLTKITNQELYVLPIPCCQHVPHTGLLTCYLRRRRVCYVQNYTKYDRCVNYSSLSLTAPAFASTWSRADRPVSGRPWTAASPPTVAKALWKTHSTTCSTGSSNMNGSAGTAARPNYRHMSASVNLIKQGMSTYTNGTPCA
jgi:hypothetical protein